jgi:hypothetical protein
LPWNGLAAARALYTAPASHATSTSSARPSPDACTGAPRLPALALTSGRILSLRGLWCRCGCRKVRMVERASRQTQCGRGRYPSAHRLHQRRAQFCAGRAAAGRAAAAVQARRRALEALKRTPRAGAHQFPADRDASSDAALRVLETRPERCATAHAAEKALTAVAGPVSGAGAARHGAPSGPQSRRPTGAAARQRARRWLASRRPRSPARPGRAGAFHDAAR